MKYRQITYPSIAASAPGIGLDDLLDDMPTLGLFFETLVVRDLRTLRCLFTKLNSKGVIDYGNA